MCWTSTAREGSILKPVDSWTPFGHQWLGTTHSAPCSAPEPPMSSLGQHLSASNPGPTGVAGVSCVSQARQEGGGSPGEGILRGTGSGCEEEAGGPSHAQPPAEHSLKRPKGFETRKSHI